MRAEAESTRIPLAPCEARNASKTCSGCQLKRQRLHLAKGKVPQWARPAHSWPVGDIGSTLVPLGGCKWVVSRVDTHSGLRFAYPVVGEMLKIPFKVWN